MADRLDWIGPALEDLERAGLRRFPGHRGTPAGRLIDGLVNLSSNDYLGLAGDPRLAEAAAAAAKEWGAGSGASRLVTGGTALHHELESAIAAWKGTEDAVVFSSGYLANCGAIPALAGQADAIFSDELNHASIIDACRLSKAEVLVYPHRDLAALERLLAQAGRARRRLVVTDGVFSMDGDAADLPGLCDVAVAHGAMVMVDDAHGCGVLGPDGRGTAAAQGCAERVDIHMGTLSKAFGAAGGYVAGRAELCEWLRNRARGYVFDTAAPPPTVAAALEGLRVSVAEPWRRERALALARRLVDGLAIRTTAEPNPALTAKRQSPNQTPNQPPNQPPGQSPGQPPGQSPGQSPPCVHPRSHLIANARNADEGRPTEGAGPPAACVVPYVIGDTEATMRAASRLEEAGLRVVGIRPPSVPPGAARLRFTLTAAHTEDDVDRAVAAVQGLVE